MELEQVLEDIGLTRNESLVYMALLQIGSSKTGDILKAAKINSGKIYEILDGLKVKGMVSQSIINNIKFFAAAPPAQILEYLKQKKEAIEKEEVSLKSILPRMQKLENTYTKEAKAVTYTGLRGIKTAADEALESMNSDEDILAMGVTQLKDKEFNEFWKRWQINRIAKKVSQKLLFSEEGEYYQTFKKIKYTEARVLQGITPVAIDIFGKDKTLILDYGDSPSCILIYDESIAQSFRTFFNQLWKQGE